MSDANTATDGEKPFGIRFTLPIYLGSTLNPINTSMLATGLVGIAADLAIDPGAAASLVSVLYLFSAVAQPTMGKLADIFGPRRMFLIGLGILLVGGAIGAVAPDLLWLLVSRALIGIGSSAAYPSGMAMIRTRADRTGTGVPSRVIGNFSIAAQLTAIVGLPIGGVLMGAFGWRALFLVNVPLAIIVFCFAFFGIDRADGAPAPRDGRGVIRSLDLPGIALFGIAISTILIFLGDLTAPVWWLLGVAVVATAAFLVWERRSASPLVDVRTVAANAPLQRTYLRQILTGLGMYCALYGCSQWMEEGAGFSPLEVGLLLMPMSALSIVLARICSTRGWVRAPLVIGSVATLGTGVAILFLDAGSPFTLVGVLAMSVLFGISNGMSNFANQAALYVQAPASMIAVSAGLLRTALYVGAIFSSSLIAISFGDRITDAGFHRLGWTVVVIGVLAVLFAGFDRRIPLTTRVPPAVSDATGEVATA